MCAKLLFVALSITLVGCEEKSPVAPQEYGQIIYGMEITSNDIPAEIKTIPEMKPASTSEWIDEEPVGQQ